MGSLRGRAHGGEEEVIANIVTTVAEAENVDADELTPLHDVVDPDALEQLFRNTDATVCVTFEYRQWTVDVRGEDIVEVTERSDDQ